MAAATTSLSIILPSSFFSPSKLSLLRLLPSSSLRPLPIPLLSAQRLPPFRPLVAQTSDWARQDEDKNAQDDDEDGSFDWTEASQVDDAASAGLEELGDVENDAAAEENYPEPPEDAKLFVGNLPYDMDSERLAKVFEEAGVVEVAEVIYNRETDQSRGFGFVTMSTVAEAEKAVEMFHRYEINGRPLTVNIAAPRGARVERTFQSSYRIYVGNLPWQVDDARLEQVFSEHGKVLDARVVYDRESGRSRGFGFVRMASQSEMDDAIAALDGHNLDGRAIRVNVAEERPSRRSSF